MKKGLTRIIVSIFAVSMLMMLAACYPSKTVAEGETWIVTETTTLSKLTIEEGATVMSSDGYSLTLTIDGVEQMGDFTDCTVFAPWMTAAEITAPLVKRSITAGSYRGKVVLTVTPELYVGYSAPGGITKPEYWRCAAYIKDGKYIAAQSVEAAVDSGKISDTKARNLKITSAGPEFNGIILTSSSTSTTPYTYTIDNPEIMLEGHSSNDFDGFGTGIVADGYSNVTVNHAKIINKGYTRAAIWAGGNSNLTVNNSYIEVHDSPLPSTYTFMVFPGFMWEIPWMLGSQGNNRATLGTGSSIVKYYNTTIIAEGWGALSTDACRGNTLYAKNCTIKTLKNGYGTFADGVSVTMENCKFDVVDYASIQVGGNVLYTGTNVTSGRFGFMVNPSAGTLTINKGSKINCAEAVILLKSANPVITIDNAFLCSGTGILLQAMPSDDKGHSTNPGDVVTPEATFTNTTLNGDIVNGMLGIGDLNVTLGKGAKITGAITMATTVTEASLYGYDLLSISPFAGAGMIQDGIPLWSYSGEVINTYESPSDKATYPYGLILTLKDGANWTVTTTSYLTSLTIDSASTISAPKGHNVAMVVDGVETAIAAGSYTGNIELIYK